MAYVLWFGGCQDEVYTEVPAQFILSPASDDNQSVIDVDDRTVPAALSDFERSGYAIVNAQDRTALDELRSALAASAAGGQEPADIERFMNHFHERGLKGGELNDFRLKVYNDFNARVDAGKLIWQAFHDTLIALVGPDVAVQKRVNLVIQPPDDLDNAPVHRDAPPNSSFEVVVWVPMVNCYGTKGMQVLDHQQTAKALAFLEGAEADFDACSRFALEVGKPAQVPYGSALVFWTPLVHAVPINTESETRWSLNLRYKNVFTPYGTKGLPDYFRILELSPLARMAIEEERRSRLRKG